MFLFLNVFQDEYDQLYVNDNLKEQISTALRNSEKVINSWDDIWNRSFHLVLPGTATQQDPALAGVYLFGRLCQIGFFIALGVLLFYGLSQLKYWNEGNYQQYILSILNPLIVVVFLSNNGALLVSGMELLRDVGNYINREILTSSAKGVSLQDAFRLANTSYGFKYAFNAQLQQCMAYVGDIQTACINHVTAQAEAMKDYMLNQELDAHKANPFKTLLNSNFWKPYINALFTPQGIANDMEPMVFAFLKSLEEAYQNLMEGALIVMGYMFPLVIGTLLLPFGLDVVTGWLSGFIGIIIGKLCFNLIAGLMATAAVMSKPEDAFPFATAVGLYAPVIASALGAGGGTLIWNGITSATVSAAGAVFDVASFGLTRGSRPMTNLGP
jgi:hypothetical protein